MSDIIDEKDAPLVVELKRLTSHLPLSRLVQVLGAVYGNAVAVSNPVYSEVRELNVAFGRAMEATVGDVCRSRREASS